jgi:hypothetical protein
MSKKIGFNLSKNEVENFQGGSNVPPRSLKKDCLSTVYGSITSNSYNLDEFPLADFNESRVKWDAEEMIKRTTKAVCLESIKLSLEDTDNVQACLKSLFRGIFCTAKSCTSNSTSVFSNAVNSAKQQAYFEVLDMLLTMQNYED